MKNKKSVSLILSARRGSFRVSHGMAYNAPVYVDGDYKIYKFVDKHYIYTFKNIVATERCGLNKDIISHLKGDTKPKKDTTEYYHNKRSLEAIAEGVEYAKMLNFKVI